MIRKLIVDSVGDLILDVPEDDVLCYQDWLPIERYKLTRSAYAFPIDASGARWVLIPGELL